MEDEVNLVAIPGEKVNSWLFASSDGFIFHRIIKSKAKKANNTTVNNENITAFAPAPAGKYRCKHHKKGCQVKVTVDLDHKAIITKLPHEDTKQPEAEPKYNLYLKLREEGVKSNNSNADVVKIVKELPEFLSIAAQFPFATLESVVRDERKKKNIIMEPDTWENFITEVPKYRQSQGIFLGKIVAGNASHEVLIFGEIEAYQQLNDVKNLNIQVVRNIETKFLSTFCIIYKITENRCEPVLFFNFQNDSYEVMKSIMLHLVEKVPELQKNVETITTEFEEITIKVLRLCFQKAKLRCTWFYFIKEVTQSWNDMNLPVDSCDSKLLEYTWILPLALELQVPNIQFNDVMECINNLPPIIGHNNTAIFKEELKLRWSSRIKYISSYISNNKLAQKIEMWERYMIHKFLSANQTLGVLNEIQNLPKMLPYNSILRWKDTTDILHTASKFKKTGILKDFMANCLTEEAAARFYYRMKEDMKYKIASATATMHDMEDTANSVADVPVIPRYNQIHLIGPAVARNQHYNETIDEVAEGSGLILPQAVSPPPPPPPVVPFQPSLSLTVTSSPSLSPLPELVPPLSNYTCDEIIDEADKGSDLLLPQAVSSPPSFVPLLLPPAPLSPLPPPALPFRPSLPLSVTSSTSLSSLPALVPFQPSAEPSLSNYTYDKVIDNLGEGSDLILRQAVPSPHPSPVPLLLPPAPLSPPPPPALRFQPSLPLSVTSSLSPLPAPVPFQPSAVPLISATSSVAVKDATSKKNYKTVIFKSIQKVLVSKTPNQSQRQITAKKDDGTVVYLQPVQGRRPLATVSNNCDTDRIGNVKISKVPTQCHQANKQLSANQYQRNSGQQINDMNCSNKLPKILTVNILSRAKNKRKKEEEEKKREKDTDFKLIAAPEKYGPEYGNKTKKQKKK